MDFPSLSNYQIDECFEFFGIKEYMSDKIPYYANLISMFHAKLRFKRSPFTLYFLVKGIMIILGPRKCGEIFEISVERVNIMTTVSKHLVGMSKMLSLSCIVLELVMCSVLGTLFFVKLLTLRVKILAKIAQFNFQS